MPRQAREKLMQGFQQLVTQLNQSVEITSTNTACSSGADFPLETNGIEVSISWAVFEGAAFRAWIIVYLVCRKSCPIS